MSLVDHRCLVPWLVLSACTSAEPPPVADPAPVVVELPADLKLTLQRSACYGTCPVYTVTIDAQGQIEWNGRDYVEQEGSRSARLESLDGLRALWGRLDPAATEILSTDQATLCPEHWTDNPTATVTIVAHGVERRVADYHGCKGYAPLEAFRALEQEIDAVAGTEAWIGKRM